MKLWLRLAAERLYENPLETALASLSLFWGVWLMTAARHSFALSPKVFGGLAKVAPEWAWGGLVAMSGVLLLFSVVALDGRWARFPAILTGMFVWTAVSLGFIFGHPLLTATAMYLWVALAHFVCLFRGRDR